MRNFGRIILEKCKILIFFNYTIMYFAIITEIYNGDLLQRTSYKRLKSFQLFMRVIRKQWSTESFMFTLK